jgi:hypothetical protein
MSNGISPLARVAGAEPAVAPPSRPALLSAAETVAAAAQGPFSPNPSSYIDPALGIVVIEFHNSAGKVAATIPTPRQLAAYRQAAAPVGRTTTAEAAPPASPLTA